MAFHIFTFATKETHHLDRLNSSAMRHSINLKVLGMGQPYLGNGMKIQLLMEAFNACNSEDVFLYVDAYDVIFCSGEDKILSTYVNYYDGKLVFGGEQNFGMYSIDDIYYFFKYPIKKKRYKYLNAGTFMGKVSTAQRIFNQINLSATQKSDQMDIIRYFTHHPESIQIDCDHHLFGVNGGRAGLEARDYVVENNRIYSVMTDTYPPIFHVPGKFFIGLDNIAHALGFMREIPNYSSKERSAYRSARFDHRLCDWLNLNNYVYRLIKNWFINICLIITLIQLVRWILFA